MTRMGVNCMEGLIGKIVLAQPVGGQIGVTRLVILGLIVVQIVNQSDQSPVFDIFIQVLGNSSHASLDREDMFQKVSLANLVQNHPIGMISCKLSFHSGINKRHAPIAVKLSQAVHVWKTG